MRSRQRVVKDGFWRDPKYYSLLSMEDKYCLLYLSTCSFSNMIGIYKFVPSIMAAEIGWDTNTQLWPVLNRLEEKGVIELDREASVVWVKIWWDNNTASQLSSKTLRDKAVEQIKSIPPQWQESFLRDFLAQQKTDEIRNWYISQDLSPCLKEKLDELNTVEYSSYCDEQPDNIGLPAQFNAKARNEIIKMFTASGLPEGCLVNITQQLRRSKERGKAIYDPIAYTATLLRAKQLERLKKETRTN